MFGFGQLIEVLKKSPKKIVFTEGSDPRILEASSRLLASNFLHPILVGDPDEIEKAAAIPMISIVKETACEAERKGLQRCGLLGTAFTMKNDFYKNKSKRY